MAPFNSPAVPEDALVVVMCGVVGLAAAVVCASERPARARVGTEARHKTAIEFNLFLDIGLLLGQNCRFGSWVAGGIGLRRSRVRIEEQARLVPSRLARHKARAQRARRT
jgi:hypothetical protein